MFIWVLSYVLSYVTFDGCAIQRTAVAQCGRKIALFKFICLSESDGKQPFWGTIFRLDGKQLYWAIHFRLAQTENSAFQVHMSVLVQTENSFSGPFISVWLRRKISPTVSHPQLLMVIYSLLRQLPNMFINCVKLKKNINQKFRFQ